jgi:hypothetical protein
VAAIACTGRSASTISRRIEADGWVAAPHRGHVEILFDL